MTEYTDRAGETWQWDGRQWKRHIGPELTYKLRPMSYPRGHCNAQHTLYKAPDWKHIPADPGPGVMASDNLQEQIDLLNERCENLERHMASDRQWSAEAHGRFVEILEKINGRINELESKVDAAPDANYGAPSAELLDRVQRVTAQIRALNKPPTNGDSQ